MNNMHKKYLYTAFQGFIAGAIVMAYVSGYNRRTIPLAIICFLISLVSRLI